MNAQLMLTHSMVLALQRCMGDSMVPTIMRECLMARFRDTAYEGVRVYPSSTPAHFLLINMFYCAF